MSINSTWPDSPLDRVLDRLEKVRKENGGFKALCPAHDDQQPSLGIAVGDDGRVLLKCYAGCSGDEVRSALGFEWRELYTENGNGLGNGHKNGHKNGHRKIVKTYDYTDEAGELLFQGVRYEPKGFSQRKPDGAGGWVTVGVFKNGTQPVLYRLPKVLEAVREGKTVVVAEGEKDVHRLEREGLVATTNPMGAEKWRDHLSETLAGADVRIVSDNDKAGRNHARKVAKSLQGKAASVSIIELPGLPEGGDVSDWFDAGGTADELLKLAAQAPEYAPSEPDDSGFIDSHHIGGEFGENKSLPIMTVEEVLAEAGESVPWIIENILSRGALTDFAGLAKQSGKTTFWCHAIAAGAKGEDHAGFHTEPVKCLYLTEQGNNFAQPLRESGLAEYPDHVRIVRFKDVSSVKWSTLMMQAGLEAHNRGMDALVVDTFAVFARLKGSEENDAGPVADRVRVLRLVAQKYDIGVALIRHAGKDGKPRGSSAFEAEADICVTLSRPEGRHAPSVRKLSGIGRYGEWERNVQLQDGRYVSLGADDKVEFNKAVKFVKAVLPGVPDAGLMKQQILDKRTESDDISASTLDRALAWLVKQGDVGEKQLMNARGKPKVYWLAYKPPGGDDKPPDGQSIYSTQTPSVYGENKSETPPGPPSSPTPRGDDDDYGAGLTPKQEAEIAKLISKGFSEYAAKAQVLAADHPLDCECEVCL